MDNKENKIQDVSDQEQVVKHNEVGPDSKHPIYIRTLNVFATPLRNRYQRYYKEKKHHLIIDVFFVIIIVLLTVINILLVFKGFKIEEGRMIDKNSFINQLAEPHEPYLDVNFYVNKTGILPANLGEELEYVAVFKNITSRPIRDLAVQVDLSGAAVDVDTLKTNGAYDNGIIKWTSKHNESLILINPGEEVSLNFKFKVKTNLNIVNPRILAKAIFFGKILDREFSQESKTVEVRVNTDLKIVANYRYYTQEGEQLGIGAWPPRVKETTSLRVFLNIENNLNQVRNAVVTVTLPAGIKWMGESSVKAGQALNFDQITRKITWGLGEVDTLGDVQASFEVEFTPAIHDKGKNIKLLQNIKISGEDIFTKSNLEFVGNDLIISEKVE